MQHGAGPRQIPVHPDSGQTHCTRHCYLLLCQMGCTQQRAVGNLHTDVLCFLNRTLECQNVGMASPSLCILILGKSYVGSKTFAFLVAFGPDYEVPLSCCFLTASPAGCAGLLSGRPPVSHILPSAQPCPATELGAFSGAQASRHHEKNAAAAAASGPG